jgi:hypothetical protein
MYRLVGIHLEDLAALTGHKLILPGDPEPAWLRRNVEYARVLRELKAEPREPRPEAPQRTGIVARLRTVLSRA